MIIFTNYLSLSKYIFKEKSAKKSIGFSPTMGALHHGHLSLINQSKLENDISICSIFVNPTQFNNQEDLLKYPKTIEEDIKLLESVFCDVLYLPTSESIYPNGLEKKNYDLEGLEKVMEGEFRIGHFDGVVEVVSRLFKQVQPDKAYFGEKDFQQLQIIKFITKKFNFPIEIIGMPILREKSGLAMSSRNKRLSVTELLEASKIVQILQKAKNSSRKISFKEIQKNVIDEFSLTQMKLEYFKICEEETLKEVFEKESNQNYRAFVAVFLGNVRLIDNMELK